MTDRPRVILIAGPGGVGKTSIAARIALRADWAHVSEDDYWVMLKAERIGELRTPEEELIVQAQVMTRVADLAHDGKNVVLEFILYKDPPEPVLNYQRGFEAARIPVATRLLRADVDEVLRRMTVRGRPGDADVEARRALVEHQLQCLRSEQIDPAWVIDTSGVPLEEVYGRHFRVLVEH